MSTGSTLLDVEAAWDKLNPGQQRRIGLAAIVTGVGQMHTEHDPGVPGAYAAAMAGWGALEEALFEECGLDAGASRPDLAAIGVRSCRVCGCTDDYACPGGCSWAADLLCSSCAPASA